MPAKSTPTNVKVIVRVRPQLSRESSKCLVHMPADQSGEVYLDYPDESQDPKKYLFDEAIWSHDQKQSNYHDNLSFYQKCGYNLLEHLFLGYNVCLLAYGQTGSGKTHTMIGQQNDQGIIPLMVRDILRQRDLLVKERINCTVSFSYVEIYNEKVRDLLGESKICRVREDPNSGPYLEEVTELMIETYENFRILMDTGNALRMTASTRMNETSSRSHAILTFKLKQTKYLDNADQNTAVGGPAEEMVSNIKLVDLAGSERISKTQVSPQSDRLREGTQINKSLTVLGRCISHLSLNSKGLAPYRDSILTWLIKENLAGNSKTSMIFCISPTDYHETNQTLNYAMQVKKIKTEAKASSSKILAPLVDWEVLQMGDQSVVSALQQKIAALSKELCETHKPNKQENFNSLAKYMFRESERQSFEIRYLKNQIRFSEEHYAQLQCYNQFLSARMKSMLRARISDNKEGTVASYKDLAHQCSLEAHHLEKLIKRFDRSPRNLERPLR